MVDGIVQRTPDGKEIRYVTPLSPLELEIASTVSKVFGQTVCGFDLLRANGKSYVIDVNGWSFVKGNSEYYDKCSSTIRDIFLSKLKSRHFSASSLLYKQPSVENSWKIKGFFGVLRHGDRTPKQKLKFTFTSDTFLDLVKGYSEELVLKKPEQVEVVILAVKKAIAEGLEDPTSLLELLKILDDKGEVSGTKVQLRPNFMKEINVNSSDSNINRKLDKMQIIVKWGGVLTHGGHVHSL